MEPNEIQGALASAVEEVLETMCFTPVLATEEGQGECSPDSLQNLKAQLEFAGDPSGAFRVNLTAQLGRVLAAAFLGLEETEVAEQQVAEVLCELSNMFCGAVLSRLESDRTFHLFHPELLGGEGAEPGNWGGATRWFDLGDGGLTASLQLQKTV